MSGAVQRGLERQLEHRRRLLAEGHRPLGWKAAFGSPANLEKFSLDGPLVGFMTDRSIVESASEVDISNWARAVAEPEIVVRIGADLAPGADIAATRAAIEGVGPAIELADIHQPPDDIAAALAVNVFHRSVILGETDPSRAGADLAGLEARVRLGGATVATTKELETLTGNIPAVVSHLSRLLAGHGEQIRAGEVIICGSVVPPVALTPGAWFEFELSPLGTLSIRTA